LSKHASNEKRIREELIAKRNVLFQRFSVNPREIKLAIEIKAVDDQIAESTQRSRMEESNPETGGKNVARHHKGSVKS